MKTNLISQAVNDVVAERQRQRDEEAWSPAHDDEHTDGELAVAAGCYAMHNGGGFGIHDYCADDVPRQWPFEPPSWKPKDPRRDLVRAAALIIAEIERLDRAATSRGEST